MTYEAFKTVLERDVKAVLPKEYREGVKIVSSQSNNIQYDGIICAVKQQGGFKGSPVIPVQDLYRLYNSGMEYEQILKTVVNTLGSPVYRNIDINEIIKKAENPENIRMNLINTKLNKEMLKHTVNIPFKDLSIVFRLRIDDEKSTIITNSFLEYTGLKAEELYQKVKETSRDIYTIMPLWQKAVNMMEGEMPEEFITEFQKEQEELPFYVITNEENLNGAAAMTDTDILDKAADMMNTDKLYVLPSSRHEIIVLPAEKADEKSLLKMVKEINLNEVFPEDKLSDNIYAYDKETKILDMHKQPEKIIRKDMNK